MSNRLIAHRAIFLIVALAALPLFVGCPPANPRTRGTDDSSEEVTEDEDTEEVAIPSTTDIDEPVPIETDPEEIVGNVPADAVEPNESDPNSSNPTKADMSITTESFGETAEGEPITLFTCTNKNGLVAKFIDYGAICTAVMAPDRDGKLANITLGFDNIAGYEGDHPYFGSTVGRYGNRIAKGKFTLDGKEYELATNNGDNHLHGGVKGFNRHTWSAEKIETDQDVGIRFHRMSKDGEEGYPGNLSVTAIYLLTNDNQLEMTFEANTDAVTVINIVNHNYWNLAGAGSGTVKEQVLQLNADKYVEPNDELIPTGELATVKGTPLDFTTAKPIGQDIEKIDADPVGYDHCYVINGGGEKMVEAARVTDPKSGRVMVVTTNQPGIQFYTGNFLDGSDANGGNEQHTAFCLETQKYPDSPNQPNFPSAVLRPGETYMHKVVHAFSVKE